jgi:hypothetical protein
MCIGLHLSYPVFIISYGISSEGKATILLLKITLIVEGAFGAKVQLQDTTSHSLTSLLHCRKFQA